ncbi:MAG: hypothetical protein MZV63_31605 [Marinilabiliales bacterium]|nr:hypothetical protein [Marinilabiliales bacterium]
MTRLAVRRPCRALKNQVVWRIPHPSAPHRLRHRGRPASSAVRGVVETATMVFPSGERSGAVYLVW